MSLALQTFSTVTEASAALKAAGARYLGGGTFLVRDANEGDVVFFDLRSCDRPVTFRNCDVWARSENWRVRDNGSCCSSSGPRVPG